jgi:hypothetical protein
VGLFVRVFHSLPNYRFTFSLIGGVRKGVNSVGVRSSVNGAIPRENPRTYATTGGFQLRCQPDQGRREGGPAGLP